MRGYILALSAGISWGFLGFFGSRLSEYGFTGNEIAFLRMFFGFLWGMSYIFSDKKQRKDLKKIRLDSLKYIILVGVVTQGLLNLFFYSAIVRLGTVTATMLLCTGPIFTLALSTVFLGEKFSIEKQSALAITILGSIILITEGNFTVTNLSITGIIFGLASGLCYGIYPIIGKKSSDSNPLVVTVLGFLVATFFLIPFISLGELFSKIIDFKIIVLGILFGILPTLLAYMLFLKSLEYISPTISSITTLIEVPTTALIGILVLNEHFNEYKLVGLVLVLVGIAITKIEFKNLYFFRIRSKILNSK